MVGRERRLSAITGFWTSDLILDRLATIALVAIFEVSRRALTSITVDLKTVINL